MVDFKKALEQKKELVIDGHQWQYLITVSDGLNIELQQVFIKKNKDGEETKSREFVYVYKYTDINGTTGRPNTKYGYELTLSKEQIENNLGKGIFTIKPSKKDEPEKASATIEVGRNEERIIEVGRQQHLF